MKKGSPAGSGKPPQQHVVAAAAASGLDSPKDAASRGSGLSASSSRASLPGAAVAGGSPFPGFAMPSQPPHSRAVSLAVSDSLPEKTRSALDQFPQPVPEDAAADAPSSHEHQPPPQQRKSVKWFGSPPVGVPEHSAGDGLMHSLEYITAQTSGSAGKGERIKASSKTAEPDVAADAVMPMQVDAPSSLAPDEILGVKPRLVEAAAPDEWGSVSDILNVLADTWIKAAASGLAV